MQEQIFSAHAQQYALLLNIYRLVSRHVNSSCKGPITCYDWPRLGGLYFYICEPTDYVIEHKGGIRYGIGCCAVVSSAATMSRLLRGKIFCSYGSNFLKSHTFTKMILRFSSQNLPRWRRFSLPSKKILQVAVGAGATTATVCGGIIYWSSGTIDSN